jgi:hypothetical protein
MKPDDYKSEFLIMQFPAEEVSSNNNVFGLYVGGAQFGILLGH